MEPLTIIIVSPNPLARIGLVALLDDLDDLTIVSDLAQDIDLPEEVIQHDPDAVLWDFGQNAELAITSLRTQVDSGSVPPVVVLLPDDEQVEAVQQAGAAGILASESTAEQIVAALHAATQGLYVLDASFAYPNAETDNESEALAEPLTPREDEVLQLVARGLPNKAIALELGISTHTVKFHVNALLTKLNAQSRTEAVIRATRLGLVIL